MIARRFRCRSVMSSEPMAQLLQGRCEVVENCASHLGTQDVPELFRLNTHSASPSAMDVMRSLSASGDSLVPTSPILGKRFVANFAIRTRARPPNRTNTYPLAPGWVETETTG